MSGLFGGSNKGSAQAAAIQQQQLDMQKEQQAKLDAQEIEKKRQMAATLAARRSGGMRQLMAGIMPESVSLGQSGTTTLGSGS